MTVLQAMGNVNDPKSLSNKLRSKRFALFEALCAPLSGSLRIIDIGGTQEFWEQRGWAGKAGVDITTVNLSATASRHGNIRSVQGDATNLKEYGDGEYDIAFSNSVIEHLFTWENQQAMAREVQRVAKAHWVQTPNFWFPMEPHFHVPGWQWMPLAVRAAIIRRWECGQRGPHPDKKKALEAVSEIRLLSGREMRRLFPGSTVWAERFYGLTKSWVGIGGFPDMASTLTRQ